MGRKATPPAAEPPEPPAAAPGPPGPSHGGNGNGYPPQAPILFPPRPAQPFEGMPTYNPDLDGSPEAFMPKNVAVGDPLYDYHTKLALERQERRAELWQKSRLNSFQKATYSQALLLTDEPMSPHIRAVVNLDFWEEWIENLGLLAISEKGWGAERMTGTLTARRYLPATGEVVEQQVAKRKRKWL